MSHDNISTWPERIWLQVGDDSLDGVPPYKDLAACETTWCADHIGTDDVEYVRADIADRAPVVFPTRRGVEEAIKLVRELLASQVAQPAEPNKRYLEADGLTGLGGWQNARNNDIRGAQPQPTSLDERKSFEVWLLKHQMLTATWNVDRNCYDEFAAHLAYKAWLAAPTAQPQGGER